MKLGLLNAKNSAYDAQTWAEYDALYQGGKTFRALVSTFLKRNPMEPSDVYEQRKAESHFRSYSGTIVDFFAAQLMAAPMTIRKLDALTGESLAKPDPFYSELEADADGVGTDIVDFCRATFRKALVKRVMWWLAVLPSNDGIEPANQAEWETRKLGRARLVEVDPEQVSDWEYGEDGELSWALMQSVAQRRASLTDSRTRLTYTWRLYDRENVTTYELTHDPKTEPPLTDESIATLVDVVPHGFGMVPFARLCLPPGLWLMSRIADTQVEHFRLSSALSWAIRRTCYAMPVFKTSEETLSTLGIGYSLRLDRDDSVEWLAPPSAPFNVISDEVKAQKDELYRVAQQMANGVENNAAAVGRSGESKLADSNATDVCLRAYGGLMREHLERTLQLVANGRKDAIKFSVEGLDRFNLSDAAMTVKNAIDAGEVDIPSATLRKELCISVAEALLPGLDQTKKDAVRSEIEAGVDMQLADAEKAKAAALAAPAVPIEKPVDAPVAKKKEAA